MPSIEEIRRIHADRWVAVRVTREDPTTRQTLAGQVVAEASTRSGIWKRVSTLTDNDLHVFFAGPLIKEGYAAGF